MNLKLLVEAFSCIYIFIYIRVTFSYQLKCDLRISCKDLEKGSSVDCCYLSEGDPCGDEHFGICDTELGYTCQHGTCSVKDHCVYNGQQIRTGEQLVIDCDESCYCTQTGRFHCVPLCSKQQNMSACSTLMNRENCCDVVQHCAYDNCSYLGETMQHEDSWIINCDENCTCYDGSVTCVPHCSDVIIPKNCTNPVLRKTHDSCCETYECQEQGSTCQYKNTTIKVYTWFQSTDCEICTCMPSGELSCIDLNDCMITPPPNQTEVCPAPTIVDSHCCDQMLCNKETDYSEVFSLFTITKYSVSSVIVRFRLNSAMDHLVATRLTVLYTNSSTYNNDTTLVSNISLYFKDAIDVANTPLPITDFGKLSVLYKVNRDHLMVIPNLIPEGIYYIKLKIEFDKNLNAIHSFTTAARAIRLPGFHTTASIPAASRSNTMLFKAVNVSSYSAVLSWSIPELMLRSLSSFVVRYKSFHSTEWLYTERLIFSERSFRLNCLYPSNWYETQLLAHPGGRNLGVTYFNTSDIKEISNPNYTLNITNISIRTSSAIITWKQLPEIIVQDVALVTVIWMYGNDKEALVIACVTTSDSSYILQDLISGNMYTVWLGVDLIDGSTIFSNKMHFVPLQKYDSPNSAKQDSIVFAVTGTCLSLVAMVIAVGTVIYLLRNKSRAEYLENASFENRIFQIYNYKDGTEIQ